MHHAIVNIIEPIFEKVFIFDSCANRKGRGSLFALKRFDCFRRKVSENGKLSSNKFDDNFVKGYCFKADIKHYFQEVNHEILIKIISKKIKDEKVIWLIRQIIENNSPTSLKREREQRVARAIVSVLSHRYWILGYYRNEKIPENSLAYLQLLGLMRNELIPKLPMSTQVKVYYS